MRIISKFQDYYDGIQAHGIDKSLVYIRKPIDHEYDAMFSIYTKKQNPKIELNALEEAGWEYYSTPRTKYFTEKDVTWKLSYGILGFCGKWYVYAKAVKNYQEYKPETKFFYTAEEVRRWVTTTNFKELNDYFYKGKYKDGFIWREKEAMDKNLNNVFQPSNSLSDELFITHKTPVITFRTIEGDGPYDNRTVVRMNGCLKDYGFAKCKDPFTCYQEISMYVGGVLSVGEPSTVEISDEDMRDKKGFNDWSFKTMPGTKKPRRRNKS